MDGQESGGDANGRVQIGRYFQAVDDMGHKIDTLGQRVDQSSDRLRSVESEVATTRGKVEGLVRSVELLTSHVITQAEQRGELQGKARVVAGAWSFLRAVVPAAGVVAAWEGWRHVRDTARAWWPH